MNFLILGAGKMSEGIVYDLLKTCGNAKIYLCDLDESNLENMEAHFRSKRIHTLIFDATDHKSYEMLLDGIDLVISTLPYRYNYHLSKITVASGIHWIDLGGNLDIQKKQQSLDETAKDKKACLIPDTGLAPGMVSIVTAYLIKKVSNPKSIKIMVGGLPLKKDNPLNYRIVFSVNGLINEYIEDCIVLEDKKILYKKAMEDLETVFFPEPFGELEAFNTSGGSSTLPFTLSDMVDNISYKTLRYRGHRDLMKAMLELGFAGGAVNMINGTARTNRELFEMLLQSSLKTTMDDVVLAKIAVEGSDKILEAEMIKYNQRDDNLSAMMICTGFPASIIAQMCLDGKIGQRGFIFQEKGIDPDLFISELARRNIIFSIKENTK